MNIAKLVEELRDTATRIEEGNEKVMQRIASIEVKMNEARLAHLEAMKKLDRIEETLKTKNSVVYSERIIETSTCHAKAPYEYETSALECEFRSK